MQQTEVEMLEQVLKKGENRRADEDEDVHNVTILAKDQSPLKTDL